jgi:hypothetical protein
MLEEKATILKVMNRTKVADSIHAMLDAGITMLGKTELDKTDFGKIKVMRTVAPVLSSAVMMIQQETAQQRNALVARRMEQLGYGAPKELTA